MDRYRRDMTLLTSGALLGVAAVMLLDPRTRQNIVRKVEGIIADITKRLEADAEEIEQEAAATEGGLAGTRDWQKAVTSNQ